MTSLQGWACSNCTFYNLSNQLKCEVCDQQKIKTNNNDNNNNSNKLSWKCENCTLENDIKFTICQICDKKRNDNNNNSNNSDNSNKSNKSNWRCSMCTFENESSSIKCKMCDAINPNKSNNIRMEYCWEWKGGKNWHEYPSNISQKIEKAYFDGELSIDLDLVHAKYIIDLTKLQQINISSNKTRSIQRVEYQYDDNNNADNNSDNNNNNNDNNIDNDNDKNNKDTNNDNKNDDNSKNEVSLLSIFEKEKNDINIPAALPKLNKRKKRKWSEISDEDDNKNEINEINKKQKVKISTKYANKYIDKSIGAKLNKELIDALWELSIIERNSGNKFKANAYSKACKALRVCGKKIKSGKEAKELDGVGKKIAAKIDELLSTGHLKKLDKLRADDTIQAINELCQIHGIGPKKAAELVKENKIFTIEELKKHENLLNNQQRIGLKYFSHINKRIPREQCTAIGNIVKNELFKIDKEIIMDICGSYRRGKKDCGDVDILITHPNKIYNDKKKCKKLLTQIVNKLKECKLLIDDLAHGPQKYMGICRYNDYSLQSYQIPNNFTFNIPDINDNDNDNDTNMITINYQQQNDENENENKNKNKNMIKKVFFRRIDLKFITFKFYYANLLYFTGSDRFNVEMRLKANQKQLILNENGVYKMLDEEDHTKKSREPVIEPKCEKDIFDIIGMDFVEPSKRDY